MNKNELPWIVVITHGNFGMELVKSAEMILGKMEHVRAMSLLPNEAPEDLAGKVKEVLKELPEDTLILTDLFGGTPSNVSTIFARQGYRVLAGVNLPILAEAEMCRKTGEWKDVLHDLTDTGMLSIVNVTEKFEKGRKKDESCKSCES